MKMPVSIISQKIFYNALAVSFLGDYQKLEKAFARASSWKAAYEKHKAHSPDPETAWKTLESHGIQLILKKENGFPEKLRHIPWSPHALYYKGTLPTGPTLAIVGTRKATDVGLQLARQFAQGLGRAGITIVSGLALGIDAAGHQGALDAKSPTVAVLACGLDQVYPAANARLADAILAQGGALVSEYPVGSEALKRFFLERNRIVSGLSDGVLIVEMPERSGAKATARFAVEQNRDVFVIPGPIRHANYAGSHALIKSGATLVTEPAEILEHLGITPQSVSERISGPQFDKLDKTQRIIIETLQKSGSPLHTEELAQRSALTISAMNEALTLLVIEGILAEENGAYRLAQ